MTVYTSNVDAFIVRSTAPNRAALADEQLDTACKRALVSFRSGLIDQFRIDLDEGGKSAARLLKGTRAEPLVITRPMWGGAW